MIREVKFESQDRRIKQILAALNANGIIIRWRSVAVFLFVS